MLIITRLVLNLVSLSKVKCLVYCEMCECIYNFIQWNDSAKTMTYGFLFCSILSGFLNEQFYFHVRLLTKLGFWFSSFLLGSSSFSSPVDSKFDLLTLSYPKSSGAWHFQNVDSIVYHVRHDTCIQQCLVILCHAWHDNRSVSVIISNY